MKVSWLAALSIAQATTPSTSPSGGLWEHLRAQLARPPALPPPPVPPVHPPYPPAPPPLHPATRFGFHEQSSPGWSSVGHFRWRRASTSMHGLANRHTGPAGGVCMKHVTCAYTHGAGYFYFAGGRGGTSSTTLVLEPCSWCWTRCRLFIFMFILPP